MKCVLAQGFVGWLNGSWLFVLSWSHVAIPFTGLVLGFWVFILLPGAVFEIEVGVLNVHLMRSIKPPSKATCAPAS